MRILKLLSIVLVAAFLAAFTYANVRRVSPTEKLKKVHLASFTLTGEMNQEERIAMEKKISALDGVTACSINASGTTAAITFYPDLQNEKNLAGILSGMDQLEVSKKEFATTGGCPVHVVSFDQFMAVLDLR